MGHIVNNYSTTTKRIETQIHHISSSLDQIIKDKHPRNNRNNIKCKALTTRGGRISGSDEWYAVIKTRESNHMSRQFHMKRKMQYRVNTWILDQ